MRERSSHWAVRICGSAPTRQRSPHSSPDSRPSRAVHGAWRSTECDWVSDCRVHRPPCAPSSRVPASASSPTYCSHTVGRALVRSVVWWRLCAVTDPCASCGGSPRHGATGIIEELLRYSAPAPGSRPPLSRLSNSVGAAGSPLSAVCTHAYIHGTHCLLHCLCFV